MKKLIFLVVLISSLFLFNSVNASCTSQYGFWSKDNFDGTCSCFDGYYFGKDTFGTTKCIKKPTCSDTYGLWSKTNLDGSCSCISGYVFGTSILGKKSCVNGDNLCRDKFGIYSSYNSLTTSCECDSGYVLKDGKCEKKHNSAYFFLREYDDDNNEAIVTSFYTQQNYLLKLQYAIGLYKAEDFIGNKIVINMGTDFDVDIFDKFILNDDLISPYEVVTNILSVELVSDSFTLKTCKDIFGINSEDTYDNKCKCKTGYKWNYNKTSCEEEDLVSYKKTPKYCPDLVNGYRGEDGICYCNNGYLFSTTHNKCLSSTSNSSTLIINSEPNVESVEENFDIKPAIKIKIDKIFDKLRLKFSKYNDEEKLLVYNKLDNRISKALGKSNISDSNVIILNYLKYLIQIELDKLNDSDLLKDLLGE